jgi:hypothetical protein
MHLVFEKLFKSFLNEKIKLKIQDYKTINTIHDLYLEMFALPHISFNPSIITLHGSQGNYYNSMKSLYYFLENYKKIKCMFDEFNKEINLLQTEKVETPLTTAQELFNMALLRRQEIGLLNNNGT